MEKRLIAGLGNIGPEYRNTRHNIGFQILDAFAESSDISFSADRYGDRAEFKWKGKLFLLLKPGTYMNLSGKAVNYWLQKEKIPVTQLLVVADDLALPFGKLRLKGKGSDGGHNGLRNVQHWLGHPNYPRLRFGIGNNFVRGRQTDYVLSSWSPEEQNALPERIHLAIEMIKSFGTAGLQHTMNDFNNC